MPRLITEEERDYVHFLQEVGALEDLGPKDRAKWKSKNGGIAWLCGDGDAVEQRRHHGAVVSDRPHIISGPGGILAIAPSYPEYNPVVALAMVRWARKYHKFKRTETGYLYGHWPCGGADEYSISLEQMVTVVVPEARHAVLADGLISEERLFTFFHIKKTKTADRHEVMKTYLLHPERIPGVQPLRVAS